jgi:hypothetical protein
MLVTQFQLDQKKEKMENAKACVSKLAHCSGPRVGRLWADSD